MFPQIVIVSDAAEAPAARELVRQTGVNAAVIEAAEEEAAARVIEAFAGNAGVAVARGRLAAALKNRADIPVIEATLSVQDMAELLEKACAQVQKERPRIAFVGQRYMFSSPETIARILRAEVTILYYTRDEELPALLDQARAGLEAFDGNTSALSWIVSSNPIVRLESIDIDRTYTKEALSSFRVSIPLLAAKASATLP